MNPLDRVTKDGGGEQEKVMNVPNNVKKFSLVKAMFDEWGHKMEWRNSEVSQ